MELVSQIKSLVGRRESLLREAEMIGREIAAIRAALGVPDELDPPAAIRTVVSRLRRAGGIALGGGSQQRIIAELTRQSPQSVRMICDAMPDLTTVRLHLPVLVAAGKVHRARRLGDGKRYWYALTDIFTGNPDYDVAATEVTAPVENFPVGDKGMELGGDGLDAGDPLESGDCASGS